MKRVHKTYAIAKKLSAEITGILYDLKELVSVYCGNLIALVIANAIPIFNHNINNPGMYFIKSKNVNFLEEMKIVMFKV